MIRSSPRPLLCSSLAFVAGAAQACSGGLHIDVETSGVYALDRAAIVAAEPKLADCAATELALSQRGIEVPIRVQADAKGEVVRIEWLGAALHGPQSWYDPYSVTNVYQLRAAPGAHARVHDTDAAFTRPTTLHRTLHLEQENLLLRLSDREMKPGDEPDVWQWAKLTPVDAQPFALNFDLPDAELRTARGTVALTLDFRGVSNVLNTAGKPKPIDHTVDVLVNGHALSTLQWDGREEWRKTLEVPSSALKVQGNRLTLRVPKRELPGDAANFIVDVVMFNWLEAAYPARGDVAASELALRADADGTVELHAAQAPELFGSDGSVQRVRVDGGGTFRAQLRRGVDYYAPPARAPAVRALASADLRAADPGFDYLIVAHPSLIAAIAPLAEYHRAHGLRVATYDVDDVYDQFGGGIAHPRAIRNLVEWGTEHWRVKPRYLLLVGDASTDIHHDPRDGALNGASYSLAPQLLPPHVLSGPGFAGMQSYSYSDRERIKGSRNLIPTWQFPTAEGQSASDNGFVDLAPGDFHPTLAVGRIPVVEPAEVTAVVDKTLKYLSRPQPGEWRREVTFISTSELSGFKKSSDEMAAQLNREGYATNNIYTDFNDHDAARYQKTRASLRQQLDAGDLLVHFLGHGGSYIWRVGPMGDLFSLDDVSALKNAGRYPMVLAMTCFSAPFDNPSEDSIGERFLREADKGAVAVYAASWKNWPNPDYSRDLIAELLKPGNRIGDAIVASKRRIQDRNFVEMYNLLGDPALVLAQPNARLDFALDQSRWDKRLLVRVPARDFGGDVAVDWLDAAGQVLAASRYASRDAQFALTPPAHAAAARVYAVDTRNGFSAFGGASLTPPAPPSPPPPAVVATQRPPPPAVPSPAPAPPGPPPAPHVWDPKDDISRMGFEKTARNVPATAGRAGDKRARR